MMCRSRRCAFAAAILLSLAGGQALAQNLLPSLDNPRIGFGTGRVQNNQPQISLLRPKGSGAVSPWYLAQWHQDSLISAGQRINGTGLSDPYLGPPLAVYQAADAHAHLAIFQDKSSGHLVYEVSEHGGWVDNGGGSNLFLSTNLPAPQPDFSRHLQFSLRARLSQAAISYGTPSARQTYSVLGMAFTGLVIQFPSPLNGATSTLFLQLSLANSLARTTQAVSCQASHGALLMLSGGVLGPSLPLDYAPTPGPARLISYDLNQYLSWIITHQKNCSGASGPVSLATVPLGQFVVKSIYIGLEQQDIDKRKNVPRFGQKQGDVTTALQISDPRLITQP